MRAFSFALTSIVLAAALAAGGLWWWLAGGGEGVGPGSAWTLTVEPGDLVEVATAPGRVEAQERVSISARVSARIAELPHRAGASVTRGDPGADPPREPSLLVRLDATELEAALRSAEAARAAQQAQVGVNEAQIASRRERIVGIEASLGEARLNLERQQGLRSSGHASQAVVDQAAARVAELEASLAAERQSLRADELALAVLEHNLDAAEAEVARARDNLSYATIHSPIDGVVTRVNAKVGEIAVTGTMNNPGTVILEVADFSTMLVVAQVSEQDVSRVEPGQPASVEIPGLADRQFAGEVEAVALAHSTGGDGGRYFEVAVRLLEPGERRMPLGLSANVTIQTRQHESVLAVPSQAVIGESIDDLPRHLRQGNPHVDTLRTVTPVVYRLIDGRAVATPVSVGPSDATHTIIRAGLDVGERIIVGPYRLLERIAHDMPLRDEPQDDASP